MKLKRTNNPFNIITVMRSDNFSSSNTSPLHLLNVPWVCLLCSEACTRSCTQLAAQYYSYCE